MGSKFGVYIPEELMHDLKSCMKALGIDNKSLVIREALRLFITEHRWEFGGLIIGAVGILYDHEVNEIDVQLTDIQHEYLSEIISALHIHVDRRNCLLILTLRGDSRRVKDLLTRIIKLRGIKLVRSMLMTPEELPSSEPLADDGN